MTTLWPSTIALWVSLAIFLGCIVLWLVRLYRRFAHPRAAMAPLSPDEPAEEDIFKNY